ncbi:transmembrane protein [Cystoisospora suis]|uniref:Transmembrane protein n=1 Tax=Cystoisospora suis TaxID=483139 RepID=A0A2C6L4D3_9APIC|nr:transmembrane protein [Cystoisospora suis]
MGALDSRALAFWVPIILAVPCVVLSLYIGFQWIDGMFFIGKAVYPAAPLDPHWDPPLTSLGSAVLPIVFALAILTLLMSCITSALVAKHAATKHALAAHWSYYLLILFAGGIAGVSLLLSLDAWRAREKVQSSYACSKAEVISGGVEFAEVCKRVEVWREREIVRLLTLFFISLSASLVSLVVAFLLVAMSCRATWFPPLEIPVDDPQSPVKRRDLPPKNMSLTRDVLEVSPYNVQAVQNFTPQYSSSTLRSYSGTINSLDYARAEQTGGSPSPLSKRKAYPHM